MPNITISSFVFSALLLFILRRFGVFKGISKSSSRSYQFYIGFLSFLITFVFLCFIFSDEKNFGMGTAFGGRVLIVLIFVPFILIPALISSAGAERKTLARRTLFLTNLCNIFHGKYDGKENPTLTGVFNDVWFEFRYVVPKASRYGNDGLLTISCLSSISGYFKVQSRNFFKTDLMDIFKTRMGAEQEYKTGDADFDRQWKINYVNPGFIQSYFLNRNRLDCIRKIFDWKKELDYCLILNNDVLQIPIIIPKYNDLPDLFTPQDFHDLFTMLGTLLTETA